MGKESEKTKKKSGYMYNWFTLLYTWNNIVNQLYSNKSLKIKKEIVWNYW